MARSHGSRSRRSAPMLLSATLGTAALLGGCAFHPGEVTQVAADEQIVVGTSADRGAWLFWAESIRILPLTKLAQPKDASGPAPSIELRVEALDAARESTRAIGTFVIAVECTDAEPEVQRWKIDLTTAKAHAERYDSVTDTYRFDVTPNWTKQPTKGSKVGLKVILYGADGSMPTATASLVW